MFLVYKSSWVSLYFLQLLHFCLTNYVFSYEWSVSQYKVLIFDEIFKFLN